MNPLLKFLLKPALAIGVVLALPSCETVPGGYGEYGGDPGGYGGYGGGTTYIAGSTTYVRGRDHYVSRPYNGYGYGGGGYNSDYYRRNGNNYDRNHDYRYDNNRNDHHDNDRDHDHDSHRDNKDNSGAVRMTKYRQDGNPGNLPTGYHSKDWYQDRGYSISKNNFETRDGAPRGHANDKKDKDDKKDDHGKKH